MGIDQEIRAMVTNLTSRLNELQTKSNPGRTSHQFKDDDEHGLNVVNLTGSNNGAVMKARLEEGMKTQGDHFAGEDEMVGTYVNSNYQAVNNSIMLGGSYTSEDPGVHMVVTDYHVEEHIGGELEKEKKKKKKEGKGTDDHREAENGAIDGKD